MLKLDIEKLLESIYNNLLAEKLKTSGIVNGEVIEKDLVQIVYDNLGSAIDKIEGDLDPVKLQNLMVTHGIPIKMEAVQKLIGENKSEIKLWFTKGWRWVNGDSMGKPWQKWIFGGVLLVIAFLVNYLAGKPMDILEWIGW